MSRTEMDNSSMCPILGIDRACRMNLDPETAANEFVAHYVRKLSGPDAENAWHRLADAGPGVIPALIRAVQRETKPAVQVDLIRALASYRSREAVSLLRDLVLSADADVWKTAIDALVSTGSDEARGALEQAGRAAGAERLPWIDEAIEQIGGTGGGPG